MSRVDVLHLRGRVVLDDTAATVAFVTGGGPDVRVDDKDWEQLLRVEKRALDEWYARSPDDVAILRIDRSLNRFHDVTYADGRTARFDSAPKFGAWELTDSGDAGRLMINTRSAGGPGSGRYDWDCAQDGSLSLLDFLATVVTYREVLKLRRRHAQAIAGLT